MRACLRAAQLGTPQGLRKGPLLHARPGWRSSCRTGPLDSGAQQGHFHMLQTEAHASSEGRGILLSRTDGQWRVTHLFPITLQLRLIKSWPEGNSPWVWSVECYEERTMPCSNTSCGEAQGERDSGPSPSLVFQAGGLAVLSEKDCGSHLS